jgi:hypothetical protein
MEIQETIKIRPRRIKSNKIYDISNIKQCNKNKKPDLNFLEYYLNRDIPSKKSQEKIQEQDFVIPNYNNYNDILRYSYNVSQLRLICKKYSIKVSGNKDEIKRRVYNYLYHLNNVIVIQKITRRFLIHLYIKSHGPGFLKKSLCTNDIDFCTLDNLIEIPYNQFFSFKDEDDFIYGYDIISLYNLYLKSNKTLINPFSQKTIDKSIIKKMIYFIKLSKILKISINIDYDSINNLTEIKQVEMDVLSLFQKIDLLGHYTNTKWFNDLNKKSLLKFINELYDIWNYRANLSRETKREISPPIGNPFYLANNNMQISFLKDANFIKIKKYILDVMNNLVNTGINDSSKCLGAYYILSALTLVNQDAAEAMPWLYEAVLYNNTLN